MIQAHPIFSLSGIGVSISNFDSFTWEDMGGGGLFSAGNATDPMSGVINRVQLLLQIKQPNLNSLQFRIHLAPL